MSATRPSQTTTPSSSSSPSEPSTASSKKKFGKNLNKLTKPPTPPIASSGANRAGSAASRTGLLLLSTKRSSSTAASTSSAAGQGLLAASKTTSSFSLRNDSSTAHDALLTAAAGDARFDAGQQAPPQAWGVAEKQQSNETATPQQQQQQQQPQPLLAPKGGAGAAYRAPAPKVQEEFPVVGKASENSGAPFTERRIGTTRQPEQQAYGVGSYTDRDERYGGRNKDYPYEADRGQNWRSDEGRMGDPRDSRYGFPGGSHEVRSSRRDDYERPRERPVVDSRVGGDDKDQGPRDEQGSYMARLAKERAEKLRMEEEARIREQRELAARRLQELDSKKTSPPTVPRAAAPPVAGHGAGYVPQQPRPGVLLEPLGSKGNGPDASAPMEGRRTGVPTSPRTLYDPNRTFSSLLGGGAPSSQSNNEGQGDQPRGDHTEGPPGHPDASSVTRVVPAQTAGPYGGSIQHQSEEESIRMIQLSSYEDRDRGERSTTAGPRMLFDPKSGSMVAAPGPGGGRGGKKERMKQKGRSSRDKDRDDSAGQSSRARSAEDKEAGLVVLKPTRKSKGENSSQRKERKRADKDKVQVEDEQTDSKGSPRTRKSGPRVGAAKQPRPEGAHQSRRLPRTCGVLYTIDDSGACVCADGCDGDEGYGCHSVPGGKVRNPDAYAAYQMQKQQGPPGEIAPYVAGHSKGLWKSSASVGTNGRAGFADVNQFGGKTEPEHPPLKVDWVKPNEKITLVTGVDDSPTLQATAHEWQPSEAALAAAAAAREKAKVEGSPRSEESEDSASDNQAFVGLGFDPTANMDSVMMSPSARHDASDSKLAALDLASLSLEPPMGSTPSATVGTSLFGPLDLGSSTWGTGRSDAVSSDSNWDILARDGSAEGPKTLNAATFLSLHDNKTWGAAGLPGLGGSLGTGSDSGTAMSND